MAENGRPDVPWPHRNAPRQIEARQQRLRALPHWDQRDDFIWAVPDLQGIDAVEALTAHVTLPVSVVGPLPINLATYALHPNTGQLIEQERVTEDVYVPLAHTEGRLAASLQRGITAVRDAATAVTTHVLHDRMTRDSCFLFGTSRDAVTFARWIEARTDTLKSWLHDPTNALYTDFVGGVPRLSRHARLWEIDTHVLGAACHVLYRFTTGEACGPNMMTRNAFALNAYFVEPAFTAETGIRPHRVLLEANMGGDKKPSGQYFINGGHGKTVLAEMSLPERTIRQVLRTRSADLVALEHLGVHGSHASGMQSVAFTPASVVAAIFAATGQDLGMVATSSMAHDVLEPLAEEDGIHLSVRFPGLEVGTVGGGASLPYAQAFLRLLRCTGPGSAYRLAQVIAAAALCLEVSAAAAASTPGSENFAHAHLISSGRGPVSDDIPSRAEMPSDIH